MSDGKYDSGGRNPNWQLTCYTCAYLIRGTNRDGGWCGHGANRVPPMQGWPNGFTPSVSSTGGCDLHSENKQDAPA